MEEIIKELAEYGIIGILIGWLIWKDTRLTLRLFKVIENNTTAMSELKVIINNWLKINGK